MTAQADHDKELPKMMTIREIAATDILPEYATSISKNNPRISPLNFNYFEKGGYTIQVQQEKKIVT